MYPLHTSSVTLVVSWFFVDVQSLNHNFSGQMLQNHWVPHHQAANFKEANIACAAVSK